MLPHPTSWSSILILYSYLRLGLPSGLFPSCFPTKTLYTSLSHTCYMPRPFHSSWFYHPNNIVWAVQIIKLINMYYVLRIMYRYLVDVQNVNSIEISRQWQLNVYCFHDDMFRQTWPSSVIHRILCDNILQNILYILQYLRLVRFAETCRNEY